MKDRRRIAGWAIGAVLALGGIGVVYYLIVRLAELGPQLELNQLLLPLLLISLTVLVLGLAAVLIRNLVRLIVERKRGVLGARLRTKLVFFFLALVLLPALVLFVGSAQLISRSVDGMLRTPVKDITRQSQEIVDAWRDHLEDDTLRDAQAISGEIAAAGYLEPGRPRELREWLERSRSREGLDWILVTSGERPIAEVSDRERVAAAGEPDEWAARVADLIVEARRQGQPLTRIDRVGQRLVVHAVAPLPAGPDSADPEGVVAVGTLLSAEMAQRMETIISGRTGFQRFRLQRRELVRLYLSLIALIFLVTLFVATWIGLYLARRITDPIQELASASREISSGNLGVRVESDVGDELGMLVEAFNEMAAELQESREVITRSTADLRRSNQALDERRRYIETLVANLSTAVISLDRNERVTTANPAVGRVLGLSPQVGEELNPVLRRSGLAPLAELIEQAPHRLPESHRRDLTLQLPRGPVTVSVQISPLVGAGGEALGTLVMVEDLTDLLRAQRAAAWREVARRIAHEIKNPLTPIQLAAQRLRKKFADNSPDLQSVLPEATASIEREVGALKGLVDEFSRFARMPEVNPRPVEFERLVDSVLALYKGLPGMTWEVQTDPGLGTVMVDAEQMRRALINLIDNALAAMNGEGTVRISTTAYAGPGSLRIEVADSGPGIPPADRDKMFVPYFSTKRRGTGLGLAIVHRVVTDHRGTIRVEDQRPRGARFVIEIPA